MDTSADYDSFMKDSAEKRPKDLQSMELGKPFAWDSGARHSWANEAAAKIIDAFGLHLVVLNVAVIKTSLSHHFGLAIAIYVTPGGSLTPRCPLASLRD